MKIKLNLKGNEVVLNKSDDIACVIRMVSKYLTFKLLNEYCNINPMFTYLRTNINFIINQTCQTYHYFTVNFSFPFYYRS